MRSLRTRASLFRRRAETSISHIRHLSLRFLAVERSLLRIPLTPILLWAKILPYQVSLEGGQFLSTANSRPVRENCSFPPAVRPACREYVQPYSRDGEFPRLCSGSRSDCADYADCSVRAAGGRRGARK